MRDLKTRNPFVGPQPFTRADAWRFYGRSEAADEVFSLLVSSRSLLLYSQSGAGKSSLVNAGILPLAEEEGFDILPPARVQGVVPDDTSLDAMGNPYTFFALTSLDLDERSESIAEALRTRPKQLDRFGDPAQRLIVLDQFEELFTSFPQHWEKRARFVEEIAVALAEDPCLHVVFCLREDYLGDMLSLAGLLPDRLRTRYRLSRLRYAEGAAAIEGPVTAAGTSFAEGVVERLINDLMQIRVETAPGIATEVPGEFIEPVQLQVVCTSLWQSLPANTDEITHEHAQLFGDVSTALERFYDEALAETARRTGLTEDSVRDWFQATLITPANTRGIAYRGSMSTAGLDNRAVDILEDLHMVRADLRAGSRWYELTHDRFIEPIQTSNARVARRKAELPRYWGVGALFVAVLGATALAVLGSNRGALEVLARFLVGGVAAVGLIQLAPLVLERRGRRRGVLFALAALTVGLLSVLGAVGVTVEAPETGWEKRLQRDYYNALLLSSRPRPDPPEKVACGGSNLRIFLSGPSVTPRVGAPATTPSQGRSNSGTKPSPPRERPGLEPVPTTQPQRPETGTNPDLLRELLRLELEPTTSPQEPETGTDPDLLRELLGLEPVPTTRPDQPEPRSVATTAPDRPEPRSVPTTAPDRPEPRSVPTTRPDGPELTKELRSLSDRLEQARSNRKAYAERVVGGWCSSKASEQMITGTAAFWFGIVMTFVGSSALWRRRAERRSQVSTGR